jgi:S1-C subfamily serine protease
VIGVNTQIATGGAGGNVGIGFAVPSNTVEQVVAQLVSTGRVDRAYLGISGSTVTAELAQVFRLPVDAGVLVETVEPGTPAAKAGLQGGNSDVVVAGESHVIGGDVIVALGDKRVSSLDELRALLAERKPGEKVNLRIHRGTRELTLEVELGRQPTAQE